MDNTNKDALATKEYDQIIQNAENEQKLFMESEGDETLWEANRQQLDASALAQISQIKYGTARWKSAADLTTTSWSANASKRTEIAAIRKRKVEALKVTKTDYIAAHSAIITEGMTPLEIEEIEDRKLATEESRREILKQSFGPDIIEQEIKSNDIDSLKGQAMNWASIGEYGKAKEIVNKAKFDDPAQRTSILRSIESIAAQQTRRENERYKETEKELHKKFIAGTLTKEENDRTFNAGESNVNTHKAYDTIIKNEELTDTDQILSEKWLNGSLTKSDITEAQKEGRLNNSSVVGAWLSRLNQGQFNAGAYDRALTKIREVQFDKGKYDTVRKYLLENAEDLGGKWDEVRNRLETAMNAKGDTAGPHVARAHRLINQYAEDNPEINDGTLESVNRIQRLHDDIDARADQTPEQIRNLTQSLLLPYEEEKAQSWFSGIFRNLPTVGLAPFLVSKYATARHARSQKQKIFQSKMLIQPVSKSDFNNEVTSLKALFGDDSKEAKQFYDRYVDSYNWETE